MSSMLELAILFQPNDSGVEMEDYGAIISINGTVPQRQGKLILDSMSMTIQDLHYHIESVINKVRLQDI